MSDEVLVRVSGVSKKFCRSLKKSLWYGVSDILSDLNPFGKNEERRVQKAERAEALSPLPASLSLTETAPLSSPDGAPLSSLPSPLSTSRDEDLREGEFYAVRDVSFELRTPRWTRRPLRPICNLQSPISNRRHPLMIRRPWSVVHHLALRAPSTCSPSTRHVTPQQTGGRMKTAYWVSERSAQIHLLPPKILRQSQTLKCGNPEKLKRMTP